MNIFYGVSTGEGNPESMTVKALNTIKKCRIIAVPRTKGENSLALSTAEKIIDMSEKKIIYFDFPMSKDPKILNENYDRIAEKLCGFLWNESVAMLNIGDVSVYSTFSYIAERIKRTGFTVEYVSGVTSFCASASLAGIPLAVGNQPFIVVPYGCERFSELIAEKGTKAIMKGGKHSAEIKKILAENGLLESTCAIENCGLAEEKIFYGNDIPEMMGYFTVFIVGEKNV